MREAVDGVKTVVTNASEQFCYSILGLQENTCLILNRDIEEDEEDDEENGEGVGDGDGSDSGGEGSSGEEQDGSSTNSDGADGRRLQMSGEAPPIFV